MGVAFIAATGKQVITLIYSVAYLPAFIPVLLLMVAGMGRTIRAACTEVLMAADRRRAALTALAVTVVLEVVLVVAFTARWGINGAAAGTALSALVAGAWGMLLLRSSLGPRPLGTLARSVVAGAAVTAVLWFLVPPPTTSTPLLIVAVAAALAGGSVVYFAGLWLLGEFGPDDIASLKSALGR
jgi:O-antigen/teichoic acid export membrane protein